MKHIYLITSIFFLPITELRSQELLGVTAGGGASSFGSLFSITAGSNTLQSQYSFSASPGGGPTHNKLYESGGKLYGTLTGTNLPNYTVYPTSSVVPNYTA